MINSNPFPSHINQLVTQPMACWLDVQYIAIQNYGVGVVALSVIKATLEGAPPSLEILGVAVPVPMNCTPISCAHESRKLCQWYAERQYFRHMMACTFLDSGLNSAVTFVSFDFQELISFRSNYPAYLIFSAYESEVIISSTFYNCHKQ